jgi:PadR family transcriptional regulator PadR
MLGVYMKTPSSGIGPSRGSKRAGEPHAGPGSGAEPVQFMSSRSDVLQGTLDLMVLKTLETLGPLHGYGIARRIEQVSQDALQLNQGTIYPALTRLEQRGWISSRWGISDNNRRARFYALTRAGRRRVEAQARDWKRVAAIMARFVETG